MSKLEHIATIDYCYWRLGKLDEALSKPKSAIEQLVDKLKNKETHEQTIQSNPLR